MSSTEVSDPLTETETRAIRHYEDAVAGIPDCFDGVAGSDRDEIASIAGLLGDWWGYLDGLDADCGETGIYGHGSTPAARRYLDHQMRSFFTARQDLLYAVAATAGITVPRPDHGDHGIETSNNVHGWFGFHTLSDGRDR